MKKLTTFFTIVSMGLLLPGVSPTHAQKFELKRDLTVRLDPAPLVQDWKPRDRAYPGQSLFIRGGPYRISDLRAELVTAHGRIQLPRGPANETTAVFRITDQMYTGAPGARLIIKHVSSGKGNASQERVLDTNFQVMNRDAVFRGPSFWRQTTSPTSPVLTEGKVSLRIRDLEFADTGTYVYEEAVPLLTIVEKYKEKCKKGRQTVPARRLDIRTRKFSRSGSWKRLPDGRIQLNDAGVDARSANGGVVVLADLSGNVGRASYQTYAPISDNQKPRREPPHCQHCYSKFVGVGFLTGLELVCNDRKPTGTPLRTIEWSLQRLDA